MSVRRWLIILGIMLGRVFLLRTALAAIEAVCRFIEPWDLRISHRIRCRIARINSQRFVFFTRGDNLANLNSAVQYVLHNEHTNRLKIVTVVHDESEVPPALEGQLRFLDEAYPSIHIEFVVEKGGFGPALIEKLSRKWKIPKNFMFIGSPGDRFPYGLAELGGVRLII